MGGTSASGTIGRSSSAVGPDKPDGISQSRWDEMTPSKKLQMADLYSTTGTVVSSSVDGDIVRGASGGVIGDRWGDEIRSWPSEQKKIGYRAVGSDTSSLQSPVLYGIRSGGRLQAVMLIGTPKKSHFDRYFADGIPPGKYVEIKELSSIQAGGGRRLVQQARTIASKSKSGIVLRSSEASIGFYKKMGFSQSSTDEAVFYIPPGG